MLWTVPALAQDAPERESDEIVVTGSLIRGSSEEPSQPGELFTASLVAQQGPPTMFAQ